MTFLIRACVVSLGLLAAGHAAAAEIVRHANAPQALILQGVTLPPGAEVLMLSGMLPTPIDPTKKPDSIAAFGDTKTQTISTFERIKATLEAQGYAMSDVVKLTVFLVGDPALDGKMDFAGMNEGYRMFFGSEANPNKVARSTVQVVALAGPYFLVEIEATAAKAPK